jgi:CheY-like chemotaxis protein
MPCTKERILVVDDEPAVRTSIALVLTKLGFAVRSAEDGFSALRRLGEETPEIVLSDLTMPGMSGIELLSVVRRRFPRIRVVAMSGTIFDGDVPSGVAADAFYQKGRGIGDLIKILEFLPQTDRLALQPAAAISSVWFARFERDAAGEGFATIECPDCLRTFPHLLKHTPDPVNETGCLYCGTPVRFAVLQPDVQVASLAVQSEHSSRLPASQQMQLSDS